MVVVTEQRGVEEVGMLMILKEWWNTGGESDGLAVVGSV